MMANDIHDATAVKHEPRRRLPIIFIYALLGPPVGAIVFLSGALLAAAYQSLKLNGWEGVSLSDALQSLAVVPVVLLYAIPFSYLFGFVQALLTGVALAELRARTGKARYLEAVLVPLVIGAGAYAVMAAGLYPVYDFAAAIVAIGIAASLVLRFLFRRAFATA